MKTKSGEKLQLLDNLNFKKWQKTKQKWQIYGEKLRNLECFWQSGTLFDYYGGTLFVSIFLNAVKNSREDSKKMLKSASFRSIVSIGKLL